MKTRNFFPTFIVNLLLCTMTLFGSAAYANHHADKASAPNLDQANSEQDTQEQATSENTKKMVILNTNYGEIEVALDAEKAPLSVANFLRYAKSGHYDGTIFHRVIKDFMIQGGGFEPGMKQKETKAPVVNEANNGLTNDKYTLAMARTNDPHSATAQFFINVKDNDFLNFSSETSRGWGYAVFGEVVNGKDVVEKIEGVQTGQSGPFGDVPLEDVVIESVTVSD